MSCLELLDAAPNTETIHLEHRTDQRFSYNRTISIVAGQTILTRTGSITAGLFAGDPAVSVITAPEPNLLDCLSEPGITSRFSVLTLDITSRS